MSEHKFRCAEDYRDHLPCEECEPSRSTIHVYRGDGFTHYENDDCQKYELGVETFHLPEGVEVQSVVDYVPLKEQLADEVFCELSCGEYHHKDCPIGLKLRDCWCTPKWLTDLLPLVTLDPCSNPFSTVKARRKIMLEAVSEELAAQGFEQGDGLAESWKGKSVFCNPPYSDIKPWARKADEAKAFIFLVNNCTTPRWYHELVHNGGSYKFEFDKRLKFDPPPRIKPSTNSRDQVLVCNREGWQMIGNRLDGYGRWWIEHIGYVPE